MIGRWMTVAAVLVGFVAMSMTVGCVSKVEFDKVYSAWQRSQERLQKCESDIEAFKAKNQELHSGVLQRDSALAGKDGIIGNLKEANADLSEKLARLKVLYDEAVRRPIPRPGPVIVLPIKIDAALRALAKENSDLMEYMPKYGMIKLKADLTFAKGSAAVMLGASEALKKLAAIVNTDEAGTFHVYAAGHTDDIPLVRPETVKAHGSNWGLSLHRAGAVVKVLAVAGVEQRRLGAVGFSKYHPVAPNKPGNRGNPLNRRVEIWIVPPDRLLTAGGAVQPEK